MNLVIGASGQVGHHLMRAIKGQKTGTYFSSPSPHLRFLDIAQGKSVSVSIDRLRPKIVYLPASLTAVDYCEEYPAISYETNVKGVCNVVSAANRCGAKVVYFSSDYIFDGESGPYDEKSPANPVNVYGAHKLIAEHYLMSHAYDYFIVRTTVVYSREPQGKNCVERWVRELQNGHSITVPANQIGTPTYAPNLAEIVVELAEAGAKGVAHIVGPDLLSRFEFALEVAGAFGFDKTLVRGVETASLQQKARRPLRAGMVSRELCVTEKRRLLGVEEGLRRMRECDA